MNRNGFASTELILMIALSLFLVLVGTRMIRNILYPPIHTVQDRFQKSAECGEANCPDEGDGFDIKGVQ